jgi:hypothetical protein
MLKGKVMAIMLVSGVACAVMMWLSMYVVNGDMDPSIFTGGIIGGLVTGLIMHVLG